MIIHIFGEVQGPTSTGNLHDEYFKNIFECSHIYNTCVIYIRQVLAIYFQVFFLALQCSDKPEISFQDS